MKGGKTAYWNDARVMLLCFIYVSLVLIEDFTIPVPILFKIQI